MSVCRFIGKPARADAREVCESANQLGPVGTLILSDDIVLHCII